MYKLNFSAKRALRVLPIAGLLLASSWASATDYHFRVFSPALRASAASTLAFQDGAGIVRPSLSFLETAVGSNSIPSSVVLKNIGKNPLVFDATPVSVPAPFSLSSTTCAGTLAPEATCTVNAIFSPSAALAYSGPAYHLTLNANLPTPSLPLTGTGTLVGIAQIVTAALGDSTFVQKTDGSWAATGFNYYGQLGLGHNTQQDSFVTVPALFGASLVVPGAMHTFAKFPNGSWAATGSNSFGQLGRGDTMDQMSFTNVPALAGASQVLVAMNGTFAKLANGSWAAAGYNGNGSLGLGNLGQSASFVVVSGLAGASQLALGGSYTFAKLSNGTWVATGENGHGQLGLGYSNGSSHFSTFFAIPALAGASQVVAGAAHTFAKLSNGSWAATGYNGDGGLGLGHTEWLSSFTIVPDLTGASEVVAGRSYTLAKLSNGSWAGAGDNWYGQLGLGGESGEVWFTAIPALAGADKVVPGGNHVFAKLSNGSWAATGNNDYGQLGNGSTTQLSSFSTVTP